MSLAQFIEQSNSAENIDALVGLFCKALSGYGYQTYCNFSMGGLQPDTDAPATVDGKPHYHKPFVAEYRERNYVDSDPVYKLFWHARGPFTWYQVQQLPLNAKQKEIMDARRSIGLATGIGMPIQSADPTIVGMNIKSTLPDAMSDKNTIAQLYAACNQFHLQRAALLQQQQSLALPEINLTAREKEMLVWCSQGKSNGVIATILGISPKTVEFHFKSLFDKLGVSSRTTAVLKAVHLRLIHIEPIELKKKGGFH